MLSYTITHLLIQPTIIDTMRLSYKCYFSDQIYIRMNKQQHFDQKMTDTANLPSTITNMNGTGSELKRDSSKTYFEKVVPFELVYEGIRVTADVMEEKQVDGEMKQVPATKTILKSCSGRFAPNTFTAIMGPSGCGKTTMLNLISGRQMSENLKMYGVLRVNGEETNSISSFKSKIGYVMQDDYMLSTFTPTQAFDFVVRLKLRSLSDIQREELVSYMISSLGLQKCKDTWVGDARIRGLSGGEKKRTSIGIQLLINPSIIFLDEPTTGLDSTTSLNLIKFLNRTAQSGRTIISTIHQPSSEIFCEFNRLLLMVDGNIIYDGIAKQSMAYFKNIGLSVKPNTNPTDFYLKVLNREGIMLNYIEKQQPFTDEQITKEFEERVSYLVKKHNEHVQPPKSEVSDRFPADQDLQSADWCTQFAAIFRRNFINQFRQPLDVIAKITQMIFFGLLTIFLYYQKGTNDFQILSNNLGLFFFFVSNVTMSSIFANVNLFNFQRAVFIRQRLSNTYSVSAYYIGRTLAVLPIEMLSVLLYIVIGYFPSNLNNDPRIFFMSFLALALCGFMSSSFGLLLSTIFADASIVMGLVPVLIIPFMLASGFFTPLSSVFPIYYPFEYLSSFRFGLEGLINAQYGDGVALPSGYFFPLTNGTYSFQTAQWLTLLLMALIGIAIRALALLIMFKISNPSIINLTKPLPPTPQTNQNLNDTAAIIAQQK